MRSELEQLEQIDQYLSGKMSPDQASAFEAQMNADPALKSMVNDQQLLIQTVSRKAMMAEINSVASLAAGAAAGGTTAASGWGLTQWVIAAVTAVGSVAGGVAIYDAVTEDDNNEVAQVEEFNENGNAVATDNDENTFDTTEYYALDLPVDEEGLNEVEEGDNTYQENEKTVYDIESDPTLIDRKSDPLNELGHIHNTRKPIEEEEAEEVNKVENNVNIVRNKKASFKGGHLALQKWFEKNLMYPGTAKEDQVQGTVKVRFYVKPTGEIEILDSECIQLLDENGHLIDGWRRARYRKSIKYFRRNAERAFRICPPWNPATNTHGSAILSEQVWFVKYNLKGKTEVYSFGDDTGYNNQNDYNEEKDGIHKYSDDDIFFKVETAEDDFIEPRDE